MPDECQSLHLRAAAVTAASFCNYLPLCAQTLCALHLLVDSQSLTMDRPNAAEVIEKIIQEPTFATLYCMHCRQSLSRLARPATVAYPLSGRTRIVVHLQQTSPWARLSLRTSLRRPGDSDRGCELAQGCGLQLVNRRPMRPRESERTPWHHQRIGAAMCLRCPDKSHQDPDRC